jgi:hypothetical protein
MKDKTLLEKSAPFRLNPIHNAQQKRSRDREKWQCLMGLVQWGSILINIRS